MFKEVSLQEHSLLLKLYLEEAFDKTKFEKELKSLYDKTYLGISPSNGFYINSRGVAFLQQQKNPFVDIQRVITYTPLKFKYELAEDLIKAIQLEEMVNNMAEKNKRQSWQSKTQPH